MEWLACGAVRTRSKGVSRTLSTGTGWSHGQPSSGRLGIYAHITPIDGLALDRNARMSSRSCERRAGLVSGGDDGCDEHIQRAIRRASVRM